MEYIGKTGKTYRIIEPALGKGGEGSVYKVLNMPDYVLKVFIDKHRTETRHRKLLTMIKTSMPLPALQQVAWPIDVVYQNGQFVGYVMPEIKNIEELNVIYSDKYISTLSEKITIAKNLCAAINAVHNAGQVCGDLNPKNIGVNPQSARVTLVDTDSYHITDSNESRVFRCEVGLPEYLAKEIQENLKKNPGKNLATVPGDTFSKETDLFALAIHIFALLMNGCHPFACGKNSKTNIGPLSFNQPSVACPQPIDNILNGYFPFYIRKEGFTTPRYAPEFDSLPKDIQNLFIRAFTANPTQRPDTEEWFNALSIMQQNLTVCPKNKNHMYSSHLGQCTWCKLESKSLPVPSSSIIKTPVPQVQNKSNTFAANASIRSASLQTTSIQNRTYSNNNNNTTNIVQQNNTQKSEFGKWIVAIVIVVFLALILKSCFNGSAKSDSEANRNSTRDYLDDGTVIERTTEERTEIDINNINIQDYAPTRTEYLIVVDSIVPNTVSVESIAQVSYSGNISYDGQCDTYEFVPPIDGTYRFEISEMDSETEVYIEVSNDSGYEYEYGWCNNGEGVTYNMVAGEMYVVNVEHSIGFGSYNLNIGQQKPVIDISSATQISDSIEFTDQSNTYTFTAPFDGTYRFEISEMDSETEVYIEVSNDSGYEYDYGWCNNGEGVTYNMVAGEMYVVNVEHSIGFGSYTLTIN